jgi:hypothetical protein
MEGPGADELAAIVAAYLAVTRREHAATVRAASRWSLAGRLPCASPQDVRIAARATSRWTVAGRIDG